MPQDLGKQLVVAVPAPLIIQCDEEEIGALDRLQQLLAVRLARHRLAQRTAQAFKDRRTEQERADGLGLSKEHLINQVVHDQSMTAAEGLDEGRAVCLIVPSSKRQASELQPGDPAFGPCFKNPDLLLP